MADTGTSPSSLHQHSGQSMVDSNTPPPPSSRLGIAALPGEGSGGDLDEIVPVRTATLPPPHISSSDHDGPVGVNVEHRTRPEHVPEEAPVRQDPLADTTRPAGTGGSRPTRGVGWIREEREVLCAVYVEATLNSEVGTDQRMENFKSDCCGWFRARLPDSLPKMERRRARSTPAIDKKLKYNICPIMDGNHEHVPPTHPRVAWRALARLGAEGGAPSRREYGTRAAAPRRGRGHRRRRGVHRRCHAGGVRRHSRVTAPLPLRQRSPRRRPASGHLHRHPRWHAVGPPTAVPLLVSSPPPVEVAPGRR